MSADEVLRYSVENKLYIQKVNLTGFVQPYYKNTSAWLDNMQYPFYVHRFYSVNLNFNTMQGRIIWFQYAMLVESTTVFHDSESKKCSFCNLDIVLGHTISINGEVVQYWLCRPTVNSNYWNYFQEDDVIYFLVICVNWSFKWLCEMIACPGIFRFLNVVNHYIIVLVSFSLLFWFRLTTLINSVLNHICVS